MAKSVNILIFLCLVSIQTSLVASLDCYACTGTLGTNSDCEKLVNTPPKPCQSPNVCGSYILKNPTTETLYRTCSAANICAFITSQYENDPATTVKDCRVCDKDKCNSASMKVGSLGAIVAVILCLGFY